MTIRTKLEKQRRTAGLIGIISWLWCGGSMVAIILIDLWALALFLLGFLAGGGVVLYVLLGLRCPRCRGPWVTASTIRTKASPAFRTESDSAASAESHWTPILTTCLPWTSIRQPGRSIKTGCRLW